MPQLKRRINKNIPAIIGRRVSAQPFFHLEGLEMRQLLSATAPWGALPVQIGLDQATANFPTITGAGETIAVIDAGVAYTDPTLGGGFGPGYKVVAGYNFVTNTGDPFPTTDAHGTGTAAVAAGTGFVYDGFYYQGVAPGAQIVALTEDSNAGTKSALDWVIANQAQYNIVAVCLLDWGGGNGSTYLSELSTLNSDGVFIGSPSGNAGLSRAAGRPAGSDVVLTGSVDANDNISPFTQRGSALSMLAPGENVVLPYYDVTTQQSVIMDGASGTSWASPLVVGTAALIKQIDPNFTPEQILSILQQSGTPITDPTSGLTYPRLNVNAALELATQWATQPPPLPSPTPPPDPDPDPDPTRTPDLHAGHHPSPLAEILDEAKARHRHRKHKKQRRH